ncbi:MAG: hypothetical protein H7X92_12310 [Chitinophagales bacterium]|nr:hypothetical protein [Hyphomicrobiales bacterium]
MDVEVEVEVIDLKRRVTELEGDAKGEKLLARRVFEAVRDNQEHILAVLRKVDNLRDDMDQRFEGLQAETNARFELTDKKIDTLREDLPDIIASAVARVLRDERRV